MAMKDANHALNLASAAGAPGILKVTQVIVDHMKQLPAAVGRPADKIDYSAVYGVLRTEAGLNFDIRNTEK